MDYKWKIEFYKTAVDKSPVDEFVDKLDIKAQRKILEALELLKELGIGLGMPHSKKLIGTPLWELRILGSDSIRVFYIAQTDKIFLLLHAFQKKKQKTDRKEIKLALDRFVDHKSRTQN